MLPSTEDYIGRGDPGLISEALEWSGARGTRKMEELWCFAKKKSRASSCHQKTLVALKKGYPRKASNSWQIQWLNSNSYYTWHCQKSLVVGTTTFR